MHNIKKAITTSYSFAYRGGERRVGRRLLLAEAIKAGLKSLLGDATGWERVFYKEICGCFVASVFYLYIQISAFCHLKVCVCEREREREFFFSSK